MTERMSVDVDGVRALAVSLGDAADRVTAVDAAATLDGAAAALPGSDSATALASLSPRFRRDVAGAAARLIDMSVAATRSADGYTGTDRAGAERLDVIR